MSLRRPGPHRLPGLLVALLAGTALLLPAGTATALPVLPVTDGAATAPAATASGAQPVVRRRPAVIGRRLLGRSVQGRKIFAWRLGERGKRRIVMIASMHGDEPHTRQILWALRDGRPIRGIDLWVVPAYNPDGLARRTRGNARGVDLNRNYPYRWARLHGRYYSGPRPVSEPETRAVRNFLRQVRPRRVISFHQPLHGVDTDTKRPGFARRLARALRLPRSRFDCGGVCHGTMTGWYNSRFAGAALTVEYGARPSRHRMRVRAPRQLLRALGARRVPVGKKH